MSEKIIDGDIMNNELAYADALDGAKIRNAVVCVDPEIPLDNVLIRKDANGDIMNNELLGVDAADGAKNRNAVVCVDREITLDNVLIRKEGVIIDFDFSSISLTGDACVPASSLFVVGDRWRDYDSIFNALQSYAAETGFTINKWGDKTYFRCGRFGCMKRKKKTCGPLRDYKSGGLKAGCTFQVKIKGTVYKKDRSGTSRPCFDVENPVVVTIASCEHTGMCKPCPRQQVMMKNRSGKYVSNISQMVMYQFCNLMVTKGKLSSNVSSQMINPGMVLRYNCYIHEQMIYLTIFFRL